MDASQVQEALTLSLVAVLDHDEWCHGSRCADCPPCTQEMPDCDVWDKAGRAADAAFLFFSRISDSV